MPRFAIRHPHLIVVLCLIACIVGVTTLVRMPVDLFPQIRIPVVVVATFYSGMPPEQIENDITGRFERFFTLGSGIDHIESRSLPGVSLIKVYFQPGTDPNAAVTTIANLAAADLRKLPPGTLPPVVLKFDASSLPVCLITLKGKGLGEARLRDLGQYNVRNQVAGVPGASVPQPFGGRYRQIMVYVDPVKLQAYDMSVMDVVRAVNSSNLILPAGDVRIGRFDYNIYANSQLNDIKEIDELPLKTVNGAPVLVADVGHAADASQIQTSIVRVDGQPSVYLPVLKQGGSTIAVVNGIKSAVAHLLDVPRQLVTKVVFDQSVFVKGAIASIVLIGAIGLALTAVLILLFFGSLNATLAVLLSIPLSVLATFIGLSLLGNTLNTMILAGLALAFPRLISNSVVVLESIYRRIEHGEPPPMAAERGGEEVALPVLAATLATAVVFFPVAFLYGVSKYLFTALAVAVVLSLAASYVIALTVVPLFCAKLLRARAAAGVSRPTGRLNGIGAGIQAGFQVGFRRLVALYDRALGRVLARPVATICGALALCALTAALYPLIGISYFPRTDPGQFTIDVKAPSGTRLEVTEALVQRVERIIHEEVPARDLDVVLSNIGVTPGFSSMYTSNSAENTATVQASLKPGHRISSYAYMARVRARVRRELPQLSVYFETGGLVDSIIDQGFPAPIDIQLSGSDLVQSHRVAERLVRALRATPEVSDVLVPQDVDYPALRLDVDRLRASELGLSTKEIVQNVITALTSDGMVSPSYWVDPKSGNDYMLTVQYPENEVKTLADLGAIPLRGPSRSAPTQLGAVSSLHHIASSTEVDHYQLRRVIDIYVAPVGEDLGTLMKVVRGVIAQTAVPSGVQITLRGVVQGMRSAFRSFGFGLALAVLLVYLILVAQFRSFVDPLLILLAVPSGLAGALLILFLGGTTLNVMSLMGVVMVVGIVVSNSILIFEFMKRARASGAPLPQAVREACSVQMRPVLITSLATIVGLLPMAAKIGTGSEAYAPLALAIIGGVTISVVVTVFIVPAAYYALHRRAERSPPPASQPLDHPAG
ncbi:MAG TPA: efflux RND transporter permease subunit [Steroidobacteraceae bacterium]|nr:efflux RND transporter permease subunit [Steroidobacteraceae bacterium]